MVYLQNIQKSFNGRKEIDNLSIEIKAGEIYGLLGANGAGAYGLARALKSALQPTIFGGQLRL